MIRVGPSVRRLLPLALLAVLFASCTDVNAGAAGTVVEAHVTRVVQTAERTAPGVEHGQLYQRLEIQLDSSLYRGERVSVDWSGIRALGPGGLLHEGDRVLLTLTRTGNDRTYAIAEVVRLPALAPFAVLLVLALLATARVAGLAALGGLAASVGVFLLAIVPAIQRGDDPLVATLLGSVAVLVVSVFVVHGFGPKSVAALGGTVAGVVIVGGLGGLALSLARISGYTSEATTFLAVATDYRLDVARLALAGLVVGSLGALVDMSVGQASTTFALASVDAELRGRGLYLAALRAGRDHIGSLINTLALAYFGAALPLVILLPLAYQPVAVALNSEEIVLSLAAVVVASVGLVGVVPVTTALSVALARR